MDMQVVFVDFFRFSIKGYPIEFIFMTEKSKPIPTRHDEDIIEAIERIQKTTGISKAEIIRRAVRFAVDHAAKTQSLNFLLGEEEAIRALFEQLPASETLGPKGRAEIWTDEKNQLLNEEPAEYKVKKEPNE